MDPVAAGPALEFALDLPGRESRRLLRALHGQLRAAILDGRLRPGLRLPSTRALAAAHGVSRNTAVAAYDLLLSEGYLLTRPGAGVYVADLLPRTPSRRPVARQGAADKRLAPYWRAPLTLPEPAPRLAAPPRLHFRLGVPDKTAFPFEVWRRLSARALRALSKAPPAYAEPQGRLALREAIAQHVSYTRAVACRAEDLCVTTGAQQAFDLLARILVTPGRTVVAVENPGYPPLRAAFAAAGARLAAVPVDEEGLVVEKLPAQARVVCVTPSHQFPLGCAMSARRRAALLEFAQARGAVVIEDDYDCEFRYGGRPLDALQTLDRAESVFYVGTFSKSLFPALRLGYIAAPPWAQAAVLAAKKCSDWHCAVLPQDTLAAFIAEGHLARHVRKMRRIYGARRERLAGILDRDFARWLEPVPCVAGLHLAALFRSRTDEAEVLRRAAQQEVGLYGLREFQHGRAPRQGLVFGYGAIGEDAIVEGLGRLRRLWRA
ncbi:MAG TPA: PLP-dependent aminotransferase family protein [Nevskia sp.]|nr:PLP-dependent aminotransferase family protein [Nevskia sp.]